MISKPAIKIRRLVLKHGIDDVRDADLKARGQQLADDLIEAAWRIAVAENNKIKWARAKREATRLAGEVSC